MGTGGLIIGPACPGARFLNEAVFVQLVLKHGYSVLFCALFAHRLGLPVPGPLFLLAAGALAAAGKLGLVAALVLAIVAAVLGDWPWYEAGRRHGDNASCASFTASQETLTPMIAGRKRPLPVMGLGFSSSRSSFLDWTQ